MNRIYMTVDEYFDVLRKTFDEVHGEHYNGKSHPEDIGLAVGLTNESLYLGLSQVILLRGDELRD